MPKSKLIPQQPQPEKLQVSQHGYITTIVNDYPKKYELTDPLLMLELAIELVAMDKGLNEAKAMLTGMLSVMDENWLESVIKDAQQECS